MSLMNDALRKKGRELKKLTGSVGKFRRKAGGVRSRKWRRIGAFSIAFLAMMAAGSAAHFFFLRVAPSPVLPMAAQIAVPEPEAAVDQPTKEEAALRAEETSAAPSLDQTFSTKKRSQPEMLSSPDRAQARPVEETEKMSGKAADKSDAHSPRQKKTVEAVVDPAERFYQKALSCHRQNRLQEAIELYLAVLTENPGHMAARFNLAAAYIQTAAFSEAFALLETLSAQDPGNPDILLNMAISKIGLQELQQALMLLNAAEENHAPAFELYFHRGVIFSRSGQLEEALLWYQKAERIHPRHERLVYDIALTYDKLQQHEAALRYYILFLNQAASSVPGEKEAVADRVRILKSYLGNQNTGGRSQESEHRSQESGARSQNK